MAADPKPAYSKVKSGGFDLCPGMLHMIVVIVVSAMATNGKVQINDAASLSVLRAH